MNETNKTFRNLLGFLLLTALFALLTATVRVENAASGWEYPPERELIPLEMIGRVEMLPSQPVEGAPPQAPPENGTPPQFPAQGAPPQAPPESGTPPQFPAQGAPAQAPPENGTPPQFPAQGAPAQAPPESGTPPQFPPGPPNFGASSTAFGPVPVDGKTWGILIIESVILALGIAFASLYKKERP